jgi:hypothetical protein
LSRLTALCSLSVDNWSDTAFTKARLQEAYGAVLQAMPSLIDLQHLTRLQQLETQYAGGCDAAVLAALSTLASLQQLSLQYSSCHGSRIQFISHSMAEHGQRSMQGLR